MALDFAAKARQAMGPAPKANGDRQDLPVAKVWLNIGVVIPVEQEDGTVIDKFIAIPKGLPLDTMEATVARGSNVEYNQMIEVGNWAMDELKGLGADLKPGEEQILAIGNGLAVQIRRVKEDGGTAGTTAAGAKNPMLEAARGIKLV